METGQLTDDRGRSLPDAGWPPDRQAPGALERLRRFCNTTNLESGAELLDTPVQLDRWLRAEGIDPVAATDDGLRRVIAVREAIRHLAAGNHDRARRPSGAGELVTALGPVRFRIGSPDQLELLVDSASPLDVFLGELVTIVYRAQIDQTWWRLKTCGNPRCRWLYYDHSKNRSGRWCSMQACGGRRKSAAYRRRRNEAVRGRS